MEPNHGNSTRVKEGLAAASEQPRARLFNLLSLVLLSSVLLTVASCTGGCAADSFAKVSKSPVRSKSVARSIFWDNVRSNFWPRTAALLAASCAAGGVLLLLQGTRPRSSPRKLLLVWSAAVGVTGIGFALKGIEGDGLLDRVSIIATMVSCAACGVLAPLCLCTRPSARRVCGSGQRKPEVIGRRSSRFTFDSLDDLRDFRYHRAGITPPMKPPRRRKNLITRASQPPRKIKALSWPMTILLLSPIWLGVYFVLGKPGWPRAKSAQPEPASVPGKSPESHPQEEEGKQFAIPPLPSEETQPKIGPPPTPLLEEENEPIQDVREQNPPRRGSLEVRVSVVRVPDGDTLDVQYLEFADDRKRNELRCAPCLERQREKRTVEGDSQIRMAGGLDAPELKTASGKWAKSHLEELLAGADEVWLDVDDLGGSCEWHGHATRDKYCRVLALVWIRKGEDWHEVGRALLLEGQKRYPTHDWLRYRRYSSEFDLERPWDGEPIRRQ